MATWIGAPGETGDWNTPANWQGDTLPGYEVVTIDNGGTVDVSTADTITNIQEIDLGGGSLLEIFGDLSTGVFSVLDGDLMVETGGSLSVSNGMTVASGGSFTIDGMASIAGGTLGIYGTLDVAAGATLTSTNGLVVYDGATATIQGTYVESSGAIGGSGTFVLDGGTIGALGSPVNIQGGNPNFVIKNGGTLYLGPTNDASSITFGATEEGASNTLILNSWGTEFTTPVIGFGPGDAIGASSNTITGVTVTENASGNNYSIVVTFSDSTTHTLSDVSLATGITPDQIGFEQDSVSGLWEVDVSCFMAGTNIRTTVGDVPVEALTTDHLVETPDGPLPVRWIGRSTVAPRFAGQMKVSPVRISAGALGENLPERDLLLSPDHAMLLENVLVQEGALVNGTNITRETSLPERFVYYHVELDKHALLFAEGALSESFVDNVSRMSFDNWAERSVENARPIEEMAYPRAKSHRQVPASVWRLLANAGPGATKAA